MLDFRMYWVIVTVRPIRKQLLLPAQHTGRKWGYETESHTATWN